MAAYALTAQACCSGCRDGLSGAAQLLEAACAATLNCRTKRHVDVWWCLVVRQYKKLPTFTLLNPV